MDFEPEIIDRYMGHDGRIWVSYHYPGGLGLLASVFDNEHIRVCPDGQQYCAGGFNLEFSLQEGWVKPLKLVWNPIETAPMDDKTYFIAYVPIVDEVCVMKTEYDGRFFVKKGFEGIVYHKHEHNILCHSMFILFRNTDLLGIHKNVHGKILVT